MFGKILRLTWFPLAVAAGVATIVALSRPGLTQTVLTPIATTLSVSTSSVQIIGANPSRRALTICTPGNTNVVAIAPAPITPVQPGGPGIIITGTATASTCFSTSTAISAAVGQAWNAIASGATNIIVLEY